MANTRNAASLILSIGALTLSIVAFGIAHNQAELQKAAARAATGAVIAAQQEKRPMQRVVPAKWYLLVHW